LQDGTGMVAKVRTVAFHGVEVIEVETQVTIASGLPAFTIADAIRGTSASRVCGRLICRVGGDADRAFRRKAARIPPRKYRCS